MCYRGAGDPLECAPGDQMDLYDHPQNQRGAARAGVRVVHVETAEGGHDDDIGRR